MELRVAEDTFLKGNRPTGSKDKQVEIIKLITRGGWLQFDSVLSIDRGP